MSKAIKCVNATNGCRVCNDGTLQLCCLSHALLTNSSGDIASVRVDDISEVLHTGNAVEIQNALSAGIKHPSCQRCWDEENAGIDSKRIRDNAHHQFTDDSLKIIELNLGTICNLKCRICGPWSSNQWNDEYRTLMKHNPSITTGRAEYERRIEQWAHSFDDDSKFWQGFTNILPTLETINVYGGEPLLVKKQWDILSESVAKGYSKNQKIEFNTNGTIFELEKLKILKDFKEVNLSVSIDDTGPRFEYERHPAKWDKVVSNLLKFKATCEEFDFNLAVCVTVNNYNIFYIEDILQFLVNINIPFYINMLHDPPNYGVLNLHQTIKEIVITKLNNLIEVTEKIELRDSYINIVNYLNSKEANMNHWGYFSTVIHLLDNIRNESFEETFPEYYAVMQSVKEHNE